MGLIDSVKLTLGKKLEEHKENSERERRLSHASKIAEEHTYRQEYAKASLEQARENAKARAKEDAYNRTHRLESITKRLGGMSDNLDRQNNNGNRLRSSLTGAGDFGRSIGRGYSNIGLNDGFTFMRGKKKR